MKVKTKLNIGQSIFLVRNGKIIQAKVYKIWITLTENRENPSIASIEYRLTYNTAGYEDIKELELRDEKAFTRKDDAKMYLYNLIAEM